MPIERERAKRLGAQLDNANARIAELEVALQTSQRQVLATNQLVDALKEQIAKTKTNMEMRQNAIIDKLDQLTKVFTLHMNVNTDAINILTAKLNFSLAGNNAFAEPTPPPTARVGNSKEGHDGPHS